MNIDKKKINNLFIVFDRFKPSINNPVIEVQLRDEIDFVCPWDASNGTDGGSTAAEYYAIYQVCTIGLCHLQWSHKASSMKIIVHCMVTSYPFSSRCLCSSDDL